MTDPMRLDQPFVQLPLRFCAETLEQEIGALPPSAWTPHPSGFPGNEAVRLVTPGGEDTDSVEGAMAPTDHLRRCPYAMEVMAALGAVWGRCRLMGLGPGATVPPHIDINYYWRTHIRIHIPIVTNPGVVFTCGGESLHMSAGECWALDTFRSHNVVNQGSERRVHLVLDTVGGERLWDLIESGKGGAGPFAPIEPGSMTEVALQFEQHNKPKVMSPWEVRCHVAELVGKTKPDPILAKVESVLDRFLAGWAAAWARFGEDAEGLETYTRLIGETRDALHALDGEQLMLGNGRPLYFVLDALVFANAVDRPRRAKGDQAQVQRLAS